MLFISTSAAGTHYHEKCEAAEKAEEAEGKQAVVQLLCNFEFIWLRSGLQINPCIRNQPTYIIVCLPDIALTLGGEGLSLKQKYRSYCYPGYNTSPYNSCFVIEMSFCPGRVYHEPNLSSYSPGSLQGESRRTWWWPSSWLGKPCWWSPLHLLFIKPQQKFTENKKEATSLPRIVYLHVVKK